MELNKTFEILRLPIELVNQILKCCSSDPSTIRNVSLVSHTFRSLVTSTLFRRLTFSANQGLDTGSRRFLWPISSHPSLSAVRTLSIFLNAEEFSDSRRSRPLYLKEQVDYLIESLNSFEGSDENNVGTFELKISGDPRLLQSKDWGPKLIHGLAESLMKFKSVSHLVLDISFRYTVKADIEDMCLLLQSFSKSRAAIHTITIGLPGPIHELFAAKSPLSSPTDQIISPLLASHLSDLTLLVDHNLLDVQLSTMSIPSFLESLQILNPRGYSVDVNFYMALLEANSSTLYNLTVEDYFADIDFFGYVARPVPFSQLRILTLFLEKNRRVGIMKQDPAFFVTTFESANTLETINVALPEGHFVTDTDLVRELLQRKEGGLFPAWRKICDVGAGGFPGIEVKTQQRLELVNVDMRHGLDL